MPNPPLPLLVTKGGRKPERRKHSPRPNLSWAINLHAHGSKKTEDDRSQSPLLVKVDHPANAKQWNKLLHSEVKSYRNLKITGNQYTRTPETEVFMTSPNVR